MKNFVYFFKHKNINAVKIGRTSGESVLSRFSDFKAYAPFGADLLGFFECDNCIVSEKEIHSKFSSQRLSGEWFNISEEQVTSVLNEYKNNSEKLKHLIIEFLADESNTPEKLCKIIKASLNSERSNEEQMSGDFKKLFDLLPNEFTIKEATAIGVKNLLNESMIRTCIWRKTNKFFIKKSRGLYEKII